MSFASLVSRCWLVYVSLGDANKLTTRNTRDANDIVHGKLTEGVARRKCSVSRVKIERYKVLDISMAVTLSGAPVENISAKYTGSTVSCVLRSLYQALLKESLYKLTQMFGCYI